MALAKFWQKGERIDIVNSSGAKIAANTIILYGSRLAVAGADIEDGEKGALYVEGTFELPKVSGTAITAGAEVYWDDDDSEIKPAVAQEVSGGSVTTEASPVHGFAVAAAASDADTVLVKINA